MANSDKDILITPHKGTANIPEISFVGQDNAPIKLRVLDDNSLSFEGNSGQLLSIDDNLTSGVLFAASDVSGVPILSTDAAGFANIVPYSGTASVGENNRQVGNDNVPLQVFGRTNGGEDPNSLSSEPNGSMVIGARNTGIHLNIGVQANTTPQYAWLQSRHQNNGSAYNLVLQPSGGFTGVYEKPISRFSVATDGSSGNVRQLTIYNKGQGLVSFGSYPGSWSPALMIQNNNNTDFIWLSPIDDGNNARFRTGGTGLDFYTGGGNDTGTLALQLDTSGNVGVKGNTNGSYALNVSGNINFTGELYQNGQAFETLPEQTAQTDGSVLRTRWDGSKYVAYWTHDLDANYRLENPDQYPFRYIINRGYTVAGYKNASPWRNGNRTSHPSDVTISLGDIIDRSAAYIGGSHNGVNLFVYNCANSWLPDASNTCSFSMITETNRGQNSSWNDTRARRYSGAWQDFLGNQWRTNGGRNRAYITSGQGNTSRHDLNTESMLSEVGGNVNHVSHAEGEYYAWVSSGQHRFTFSNEGYSSWSSYSPAPGNDGFNKHLATRIGFFYCSQGGNTNRDVTKRRDNDAVILRSGITKPENGGEENMHTGMNKGYSISNYNGAQNNNAWIYFYYQDSIRFADGTLTYRKGIPGASSGTGQEGGDMMGAGITPRTYMTYSGNTFQSAPGTITYGNTIYGDYAGEGLADGTGSTGGIGSY